MFIWKMSLPAELLKNHTEGEMLWSFDCGFNSEKGVILLFKSRAYTWVTDAEQRPITFCEPPGSEAQIEQSNNDI